MIDSRNYGLHQRGDARTPETARGFTLIEMAVAVFVISLILGGMLVPLATQVEQRQVSDTQKALEDIRDALVGFAVANGYLPCPDTGSNGSENVSGGYNCSTQSGGIACGRLPHANLGLGNSDLWGNRFTYCVNEQFARRGSGATFTLSTPGNDLQICATSACVSSAKLSTTAVFAVVSHGKNGSGAVNYATNSTNPGSNSADEQDNYNGNGNIVSRPRYTGGLDTSEFDDVVVWQSRYILFNRMVAAGKLP